MVPKVFMCIVNVLHVAKDIVVAVLFKGTGMGMRRWRDGEEMERAESKGLGTVLHKLVPTSTRRLARLMSSKLCMKSYTHTHTTQQTHKHTHKHTQHNKHTSTHNTTNTQTHTSQHNKHTSTHNTTNTHHTHTHTQHNKHTNTHTTQQTCTTHTHDLNGSINVAGKEGSSQDD